MFSKTNNETDEAAMRQRMREGIEKSVKHEEEKIRIQLKQESRHDEKSIDEIVQKVIEAVKPEIIKEYKRLLNEELRKIIHENDAATAPTSPRKPSI